MQKQMYYKAHFARKNILLETILTYFYLLASYPRLMLEVFIRKNFGERYFGLMSAISVAFVAQAIPAKFIYKMQHREGMGTMLWHYGTYYIFIIYFLVVSWQRHQEVKRNPSVFDFAKFSVYSGTLHPKILGFTLLGKTFNRRQIETLIEPGFFFVIGLILFIIQQRLGILLMVCSVFYSLGYVAAYLHGDHYVMNIIDQKIYNQSLQKSFLNDEESDICDGFRGRKPNSQKYRQEILGEMLGDDEFITAK